MARVDDQTLSFGFDAGNYSAAYDGLSLAAGLDKARHEGRLAMSEADVDSDAFAAAFTLGYLSALEDDEMGDDADAFLEALESEAGRRCVELGYIEYIDRKSDAALRAGPAEPGQTIDAGDVVIETTLHRLG